MKMKEEGGVGKHVRLRLHQTKSQDVILRRLTVLGDILSPNDRSKHTVKTSQCCERQRGLSVRRGGGAEFGVAFGES